jgi:CheY-like chemotaxis protein
MTTFTPPLDSATPCLAKPFTAATLVGRVQQVLAESRRLAEALQATIGASIELQRELQPVLSASKAAVRQSRHRRAERYCSLLRTGRATTPTILVAEDDPIFRYAVCRFLAHRGFTVWEAPDGRQALELSRERCGSIDMLVTNIQLPGLDGLELAKAVGAERPRTRIVFMTAERMELPHPAMQRPFELEDLLASIVDILLTESPPGFVRQG